MTLKQEKLIENYVRTKVRSMLKENIDMKIVATLTEKLINDLDAQYSGVVQSQTKIPQIIITYLKTKYKL